MNDLIGHITRGYEIRSLMGEGGFGAVYRAYQASVAREVAMKIILPQYANQEDFIRRFETEARLVARLEHPFIVPLFDFWREPAGAYLVMRLLKGGSLSSELAEHRLEIETVSRLLEQIAGALAVAHRNNVIHRDLKPDNILLDEEGNGFLSDFGIATIIGKGPSGNDADEGVSGSPGYISPEQITGDPVTPQTDIYSLGIMLYEMIVGVHPYGDSTSTSVIAKHLQEQIPQIDTVETEIPWEINDIIQRATAKNPGDRYASVLDLVNEFKSAVADVSNITIDTFAEFDDSDILNPYKGLRPFEEADAADFFGRDLLVRQLVNRLSEDGDYTRFLAVVGPSGSGKSSVVKAGLLPALRWGDLPGSEYWYITEMIPGTDPLANLEAALLRVASDRQTDLAKLLREEDGLTKTGHAVVPADSELLLVIDQFEEVFTLTNDEKMRSHFLDLICSTIQSDDSNLRIIVTLRADFYDRPLSYDGIGMLMRSRTEVVLPLSPNELERAITGPAERVGLIVDTDFLAAIVSDVREEPGALPLLQYVMMEVFERRQGRVLTLQAYVDSGGARGALARRAAELYAGLPVDQQGIARQLFLRLVTLGEGAEDTRRRVQWAELLSFGLNSDQLQAVLDIFGKHRLLSFDRDPQTREPTVEVAHEALIREWQQLREWLDASRSDVRMQRSLATAVGEWQRSNEDHSFLLRGNRLTQYEEWMSQTDLVLTDAEKQYLLASIEQRKAMEAAELARQEREAELERRAKHRLRVLVGVLAVAFVVAIGLSVLALLQRQAAAEERDRARSAEVLAQREASVARSLALSASAEQLATAGDNRLALTLALEANTIESPPEQAQRVLSDLAYSPGLIRQIPGVDGAGHTAAIRDVDISPDSQHSASVSDDGSVIVWETSDWSIVHRLLGHDLPISSLSFHPDSRKLLTGSSDQTLILWDAVSGEQLMRLRGHNNVVYDVTISPDGMQALSGSPNEAILWDLQTGKIAQRYAEFSDVRRVLFHPDGDSAFASTGNNSFARFDLESGEIIQRFGGHNGMVLGLNITSDGERIVSSARGEVIVWDVASGSRLQRFISDEATSHPAQANINAVAFALDGQLIVSVSDAGAEGHVVVIRDVETGDVLHVFDGHTDAVTSLALTPDEHQMITASADQKMLLWSLVNDAVEATLQLDESANQAVLSPDETLAAVASDDNRVILWELATQQTEALEGHNAPVLSVAFNPAGTLLASGSDDGVIVIWDVANRKQVIRLTEHSDAVSSLEFSADGRFLISGSDDQTILVWGTDNFEVVQRLTGHERRVLDVAISADGQYLVSGGADRRMILWDLTTGEIIYRSDEHERRVVSVAFNPDGTRLLSASDDGSLFLWDRASGDQLISYSTGTGLRSEGIHSAGFSNDGERVVAGTDNGFLIVWDVESSQPVRIYQSSAVVDGGDARILSATFASDDARVLSAARDGSVRLWRVPSLSGLIEWTRQNRFTPDLSCGQIVQYRIDRACSE